MSRFDRRTFLKGAGALGLASLVMPVVPGAAASFLKGRNPLQHVIVDLQENRSFDHYYGFASFAGKAGVPPGYTQPNGSGGTVAPYHFTSLTTPAASTTPRPSALTTSARSSVRRGRTASTPRPAPPAGSRPTAFGATASSTIRSSSTCSRTPT
ncbi:MAG: twin-arginine translocation signal domain-containing protein [Chloroflexi bacterium]|nr:MAG: twin-arginine translocation signal domain-containing protein [Chloroflexota bacterium]